VRGERGGRRAGIPGWFPVSGFWFLEKKPFSVGRASVPAQASPRPQPLFSWFAGDPQVMAITKKIQWSVGSGQWSVVCCPLPEKRDKRSTIILFSAHGSRFTAHGQLGHAVPAVGSLAPRTALAPAGRELNAIRATSLSAWSLASLLAGGRVGVRGRVTAK
jgi:hypothetical protein